MVNWWKKPTKLRFSGWKFFTSVSVGEIYPIVCEALKWLEIVFGGTCIFFQWILGIVNNFLARPAEDISITCQRCWIWPPPMRHMTFSAAKGSHNTATIWVVLAASIACLGWFLRGTFLGIQVANGRGWSRSIGWKWQLSVFILNRDFSGGIPSLVFQNPRPCESIFVTP